MLYYVVLYSYYQVVHGRAIKPLGAFVLMVLNVINRGTVVIIIVKISVGTSAGQVSGFFVAPYSIYSLFRGTSTELSWKT